MASILLRRLALFLLVFSAAASAQDWPRQPVRWIVPYPAGGGSDVIARTVAQGLEKRLGQTLVVENRPGAGTLIGASAVAQAKPDGYVVGTADSGTLAFNGALYAKLPYDPAGFTAIGGLARFPLMLAVREQSPLRSLDDLVRAARAEPGRLGAASAGAGSPHHLALELFKQRAGIDLLHVPYKGAAPAIQDLLGGQVDLMFIDMAAGQANIQAGKLRVLAVATPERLAVLKDVPTMAELGYADFNAYAWQGMVGPGGLPQAVVEKLATDLRATLSDPETADRIRAMGVEPMPMAPADFQAYAEKERAFWSQVIAKAGIKLD